MLTSKNTRSLKRNQVIVIRSALSDREKSLAKVGVTPDNSLSISVRDGDPLSLSLSTINKAINNVTAPDSACRNLIVELNMQVKPCKDADNKSYEIMNELGLLVKEYPINIIVPMVTPERNEGAQA